jgi:Na+/melibiose symporter-like transporter
MKQMNQWSLAQWALFTNSIGAMGLYLGFASGSRVSNDLRVYIAVPTIVLLNLAFLVVRPRIAAARAEGSSTPDAMSMLYTVLSERPWITAICALQLVGATRSAASTVEILQASTSAYVRSLPNAQSLTLRLLGSSVLMGLVALLWAAGAIGLWAGRKWAWWLALILNMLAAAVSGVIQFLKPTVLLFDPWATTAVVLLLLRPLRRYFRIGPGESLPA